MINTENFYKQIPVIKTELEEALTEESYFKSVPNNWHIIVTDIENSTDEFNNGKYKEMNIISASSIIIALNIADKYGIEIPFIYGGDGASILVPQKILDEVLESLTTLRNNAKYNFKLSLRVGSISIENLKKYGHRLKIAKIKIVDNYTQAIFLGVGLAQAEKIIKNDKRFLSRKEGEEKKLNLSGLQCRWNEIEPPAHKKDILVLIIQPLKQRGQSITYKKILEDIENVYGSFKRRHPIGSKEIGHSSDFKTLSKASKIKYGRLNIFYTGFQMVKSFLNKIYIKSNIKLPIEIHEDYIHGDIATATDTLKIDGSLKTILAGSKKQKEELLRKLKQREKRGEILFGHFGTESTTITCYVHKREKEYINFIDGTDGGYIKAAQELKAKIKALK
jgi:predicted nucleic acid-binding protein